MWCPDDPQDTLLRKMVLLFICAAFTHPLSKTISFLHCTLYMFAYLASQILVFVKSGGFRKAKVYFTLASVQRPVIFRFLYVFRRGEMAEYMNFPVNRWVESKDS